MINLKTCSRRLLSALACAFLLPTALPAQAPAEENEPARAAVTNALPDERRDSDAKGAEAEGSGQRRHGGTHHEAVVSFGKPAELKKNDSADAVVAIGSNARVFGRAHDSVVAIFGDVEINGGEVGDTVVAILGQVRLTNQAKIKGDVVAIGGPIDVSDDSSIEGTSHPIDIGWFGGPNLNRFKAWFIHCVLKLRPLAIQVPWVWTVGGVIFLIYLFVGALFPRPVLACVGELTRRPITTLVLGGVSLMLLSVIFVILVATGIGLLIVPFLLAASFFGLIIGKVATLEWLGLSIARQFGGEALAKPLIGLVVGGLLFMVLYLVPVLGLVTFGVFTVWAVGCSVTAAFSGLRKEAPERPAPRAAAPPAAPTASPVSPVTSGTAVNTTEAFPGTTGPVASPSPTMPASPAPIAPQPGVPEALAYPRAGFWERLGAGCLDIILIGILAVFFHHPLPGLLLGLVYFVGMWTWRGTTIGGIVLGLKVVRADSQPLTLTTAIVRALAGTFSIVVFFLGMFWIAVDSEKQGWHDRIAGTLVLRLPRSAPLVCL